MTAWWFLIVLALVLAVIWFNLARRPGPRAKIGPDGTNVREPETFVVHHEGKGQGLDIANTALKERTEELRRDLPGDAKKIKDPPIPGRDLLAMDKPPSDVSRYGDEKVAPGAEPKEKVLTEGPIGSRPGTPEEPGSPYAKGRRVTDNHRDMEAAAELLPNAFPGGDRRVDRDMAASPSTNGEEPGYGLGRTAPGMTDGEGGEGDRFHANTFEREHETERRGRVLPFPNRHLRHAGAVETDEAPDWSALQEDLPLPDAFEEDVVVALVRNPRSLYVYWERSGYGDENVRSMLGEAEFGRTIPCLRVFDVTSGAWPGTKGGRWFTIPISEHDDHWFINSDLEPGHRYVVSYERRAPNGEYYMLSHSAPVQMPHAGPEEQGELYRRYGRQPGDWSGSPWR